MLLLLVSLLELSTAFRCAVIQTTMKAFGRLDLVVYNAGAIMWQSVRTTPLKRYDLMHGVNARAPYQTVQAVLPIFEAQKRGVCTQHPDTAVSYVDGLSGLRHSASL